MDYTRSRLAFKIKKVVRYIRLYGVRRTLIKVRGQYHMNKRYETLPPMKISESRKKHVGIIGCGNFAFSNIAFYLKKNYGAVIRACMDTHIEHAASLFETYDLLYYSDQAEKIIQDPSIDLVFIASNHASHAEYAIRALEQNKSVHIEKPHVVTEDQLRRLVTEMLRSKGRVSVGFNRPNSPFGRAIKSYLDSQTGPAIYNWFIAGHEIPPDHWYFKEEEGGRVLGNLCHWIDFIYQLVPEGVRFPVEISPTPADNTGNGLAVAYRFADNTVAAITFSAKGHTFEGVRERFAAHRGDVLVAMEDFKTLTVEVVEKRITRNLLHRDHGHETAVRNSYALVRGNSVSSGCSPKYIWESGMLFLKTKEALERNAKVEVLAYENAGLEFAKNHS